ncbi:MAG: hypothetical protein FJ161_03975, partial [Gammaproteobacteria bacterium]|nr:hypothetical protein [Gammaproteobacteria bacterium]
AVLCAKQGLGSALSILIKQGVNPNYEDRQEQKTLLDIAIENNHEACVQSLIDSKANLEKRTDRNTPLTSAVQHGNVRIVEMLLNGGARVDALDGNMHTALSFALENGQSNLAELLLNRNANPNGIGQQLSTPLISAASFCPSAIPLLIEKGAKVDAQDALQNTGLIAAVKASSIESVNYLIEAGANLNIKDSADCTALIYSAIGNRDLIAKALVNNESLDINASDRLGQNALMHAAIQNSVQTLEILLPKADIDLKDNNELTAVMHAATHNSTESLKSLITAGANIHLSKKNGITALMLAAQHNSTDSLDALIQAGADMEAQDEQERTALMHAAIDKGNACLMRLIEKGANLNAQDKHGRTVLMHILICSPQLHFILESLEILLNKNNENIAALQDSKGYTALMHAASNSYLDRIEIANEVAKLLIKHTSNLNIVDNKGNTALMHAAKEGNQSFAKELIQAKSDLNLQNEKGNTALILAAQKGNYEVGELLIKADADLNVQNHYGETALMSAVRANNVIFTKQLIAAGANLNLQNKQGDTALTLAAKNCREDIAELLMQAGADLNVQNHDGVTALMSLAAQYSQTIQEFIDAGADIDLERKGFTALYTATEFSKKSYHIGNIRTLENAGAEVLRTLKNEKIYKNPTQKDSDLALLQAAKEGDDFSVRELLKSGANINIRSRDTGLTALELAITHGHSDVIKELMCYKMTPCRLIKSIRFAVENPKYHNIVPLLFVNDIAKIMIKHQPDAISWAENNQCPAAVFALRGEEHDLNKNECISSTRPLQLSTPLTALDHSPESESDRRKPSR